MPTLTAEAIKSVSHIYQQHGIVLLWDTKAKWILYTKRLQKERARKSSNQQIWTAAEVIEVFVS